MKTLLLGLLLLASGGLYASEETYTFGVVPQQAAARLAQVWAPLLAYLGRESGLQLQFKTASNIPVFEQRLAGEVYDFAYMNPYHFTVFNQQPGYQALARARDKLIRGILVVRKDSTIQTLQDLDNVTIAFPAPAAFAATILPRGELAAMGNSIEPRYVSSHDSVYLSLIHI